MLKSTTAQANSLKAMYGDAHAAHMPASFNVHLFTADPDDGGTELAQTGGYAPLAVANTSANFPDPDATATLTTAEFSWTSTGAWSDVATYAELRDGSGVRYDGAPLGKKINVTASGTVVPISMLLFYNDLGQ